MEVGNGVGMAPFILIWANVLLQVECSDCKTLLSSADSAFHVLHSDSNHVNLGVLIMA